MPNANSQIKFMVGTSTSFNNLQTKDTDTLYFLTDTRQIFVGADEYTKSVRFLNSVPTSSTEGVEGIVYVYSAGNTLYTCSKNGNAYDWTVIATLTNCTGSVTGNAITFVKGVSISGQTLTGTTQLADVNITNQSGSIPTSQAVIGYVNSVLTTPMPEVRCIASAASPTTVTGIVFSEHLTYNISFNFSSVWTQNNTPTGNGSVTYNVNGTDVRTDECVQGKTTFNIMPYLSPNTTSTVIATITDSQGNSRQVSYSLTTENEALFWRVRFFNEETLLGTYYVQNNGNLRYSGSQPTKAGYYWEGWDKSTVDVQSDLDVYAVFSQLQMPSEIKDTSLYDYIWTNDPRYTSAYTLGEFLAINDSPNYQDYITIGDMIRVVLVNNGQTDYAYRFRCVDFKHFRIFNTSDYANVVWDIADCTIDKYKMNTSATNATGFAHSYMLSNNFPILLAQLPDALVNSMPELYYPRFYGTDGTTSYEYVKHKLFMESAVEMGIVAADAEGYVDEVDSNSLHAQFPYYVSNDSRIKHEYNGAGVVNNYWTATPYIQSSTIFWSVSASGSGSNNGNYIANFSSSVGFGFCLGRS